MTSLVLLVDDDADLRALLRAALTSRGLEVVEAGSVREAESVLGNRTPDLIIIDGLLPDGRGIELVEAIRRRDHQVRIVFVSAYFRDLTTFTRLTTELDVALVVYKPIDPPSFAAKVVELVASEGVLRAPAPAEPAAAPDHILELAKLHEEFTERLPGKIAELAEATRAAKLDRSCLDNARTLAHRLRGSAGSYGHPAVGETVGIVEDLLAEVDADGVGRRLLWEDLEQALRDARAAVASAPVRVARQEPATPLTKSLLVVDDDVSYLQMVRAVLRRLDVNVVTAQSADEALQRAGTQPLVGAILDVHLAQEDAFELARRLRGTPGNAEIPIAFASADSCIETRVAAMAAGGSRFFEKPIMEDSFGELVLGFVRESDARQTRVLVIHRDLDVAQRYAHDLRAGGLSVDTLASAEGLIEQLETSQPDILLIDVDLPKISGIDVCRALRMAERWESMPILILTAHPDADTRIRSYRAGASDVIAKPVLAEELLARVGMQEERIRLFRDRIDKDPLSGLLLRRSFVEAFQRSLSTCNRSDKPLALALIDIDHFKRINDAHGHLVGDQVISRLGELFRNRFRVEDLRARWGGEEFVLVFVGSTREFAELAVRRLLSEFSELQFAAEDGAVFGATFTAGVVGYPDDGTSIAALIRCADQRLYVGKRAGRNRITSSPVIPLDTEKPRP